MPNLVDSTSSPIHHNTSLVQQYRQSLSQWLDRHDLSESGIIMVTSLIVGVGAGLGAVIFRLLIHTVQTLAYGDIQDSSLNITALQILLIPAIGGLIIGPLIYFFAREAKGHGVPEVMEAVALKGGRIRPRVAFVKSVASSICIGTGGSVGREGPIVQIGSALGSTLGQALKFSDERVRSLVAAGAAGGIAATFNAPIAGSIFALEVILGQFQARYFGAVVISAVVADVIAHIFEGNLRAFTVPAYTLVSPWELSLYALLGLLAALAAVAFTRLLYFSEDIWDQFKLPEYLKPALGGLILGILGLLIFKYNSYPRVFGVGYETIDQALSGQLLFQVTLALLLLKMIATSLTLGSGGSGGIFAPSLFMGAMLGNAFGQMAHWLFPDITAPAGAYALVGMAAFMAGAAHTPITAILILFEMTGDYRIILPLMLASVISTLVSRIISKESIYTLKLSRRGIHLEQGQDIDLMQGVTVGEAMNVQLATVQLDMPLSQLADQFDRTHHHGLPVIDNSGNLAGAVSIQDLDRAIAEGPIDGKTVADIATTEGLLVAYPSEPMGEALRRLGTRDISMLPVVEYVGSQKLVGSIRRRNIVRAYQRAIVKRAQQQHRVDSMRLGNLDEAGFMQIDIPPQSPVVGQRLSKIKLPSDCLIVSIRRGRKLHIAHGYTVIQSHDQVTVFADHSCVPIVRQQLTGESGQASAQESPLTRYRDTLIPIGNHCSDCMIKDLSLPHGCILVSIQRNDQVIVPHGNTTLKTGDIVQVFGNEDDLQQAEAYLSH